MKGKSITSSDLDQQDLGIRQELFDHMALEGFVPGSQKAYGRAFDQFAASLSVHALSGIFRTRFRDALRQHYPQIFARMAPDTWKRKRWVVHAKPVGAG